MKTRILFLDDEPLALQGLQRMLRNMRDAWDMVFVESGARALEVMNQSPVDLVVTDMLMPGMNGAQFLNEVRSRYPQTARLILSGHADKELILQCVGSAHQYLSKPCQPERLKEVLIRVCQLTVNLLGNTMAARTLNQIDRVPSVPSHYIEIVETLLDADVLLDDVTAIAAKDPGIAVTVLKLVNSPFFGTGRDISDVAKAISCLGLESFRALVFNVNAFSQFESTRFRELRIDAWARENLQVAAVARRITQAENADAKTCQDAHTAGLLHEIGGLVMASHFPEKYSDAVTLAKDRKVELARRRLRCWAFRIHVGAYLLGLWGLPCCCREAVRSYLLPAGHRFGALALSQPCMSRIALVMGRSEFSRELLARRSTKTTWPKSVWRIACPPGGSVRSRTPARQA